MKLESLKAIQTLSAVRDMALLRQKRLAEEPLRLVLGKGSGELEVVLTATMLSAITTAAIEAVRLEIEDLDTKLRALGVDL